VIFSLSHSGATRRTETGRHIHERRLSIPSRSLLAGPGMPACWVARSKISDPVEYKKYTDLVPGIIAKYGGKVLARGGHFQIMEGPSALL